MNEVLYPTIHYLPHIINSGSVYIDKTQFVVPLMQNIGNSAFFLSRPRRFGKSMFVSTLEQVFLGKKELFKGLYIYDKIEWDTYPVIRLSMDKIGFTDIGLEKALFEVVDGLAKEANIELEKAFSKMLLKGYAYERPSSVTQTLYEVEQCLQKHDLEGVIKILTNMFKTLPSHFFTELMTMQFCLLPNRDPSVFVAKILLQNCLEHV